MTPDINNTSLPDTGVEGAVRAAAHKAFWASRKGNPMKVSIDAAITAALSARASVAVAVGKLTLSELQRAHVERQKEWCPEQVPDLSFRGNEMAGEVGETIEALYDHIAELGKAAGRSSNLVKKLERERHGWRGSRATKEQLAEELADVIHTTVLCAITSGVDIEAATIAKFDATSEKNNLATRIRASLTAPVEETPCTDCGGTGVTYQSERRCACQPASPSIAGDSPDFRAELLRITDILEEWTRYHSQDMTADIEAAIFCARQALRP